MRLAVVALVVIACGGDPPPPATPPPVATKPIEVAPPAPPVAPPAKPSFPGVPATPVGEQLAWTLDVIVNRHGVVARAEIEAHFHPSFLAAVPVDQAIAIFGQMADKLASLVITDVKGEGPHLVAHAKVGTEKLRIGVELDPATGKMAGLLFQPDVEVGPKPSSFDEAQAMLAKLAPHAQLLVASLDQGTCKPLHALAAKDELAIGSSFKLYVLLGLADQMIAGKLAWDRELEVKDDWKSLPSGITQDNAGGTKLTIRTLAERMISISDNTATDHLLYTVGRKLVEAAVQEAKHAKPGLVTPFLSTRELFLLKLGAPDEMARYSKLSEAARRTYLDTTLAGKHPALADAGSWTAARQIDKLEWFASGEDLCRVMGTLWTRAQDAKAAPLLDVLAKNPGLPIDAKTWPYVGFKGGSEPGVLNLTYLLRRDDDKWFVVTLGLNSDEGGTVEESRFISVAAGVIELLGKDR